MARQLTGVVVIAMRRDTGERVFLPQSRSRDDVCAGLRVDERPATHRPLGDVPERWGRCHYVQLLRQLALAKPSAVALDVSFRPRDDLGRREDRALAQAMRTLGNVVLVQRLKIAEDGDGNPVADTPVEISREIAEAALGLAPMPLPIFRSSPPRSANRSPTRRRCRHITWRARRDAT